MKLVITMSRRYGTGASVIANELSERLDIPVYTKDFIEQELKDKHYDTEAAAIRELAKEPCIIVGRCASDILKDRLNVLNIYVCADKEDRIHRIMNLHSLSYDDAKQLVENTDKERADYYFENTGKTWGDVNDYHMILDTSELGVENCADILIHYFEKLEYI
ncbi:MAG: cytidylate kinase-like family protein [Hespellia sp.]|nr:cytidylate kinase-like family protein [Hespellia sp.]